MVAGGGLARTHHSHQVTELFTEAEDNANDDNDDDDECQVLEV